MKPQHKQKKGTKAEKLRTQIQVDFGNAVRKEREKHGYNQDEFAAACGLHRTYIGAIERGERNLSLENIVGIASTLRIKAWTLLKKADL